MDTLDIDKCVDSLYLVLNNVMRYLKDSDKETKIDDLREHLREYCFIEWQQNAISEKKYNTENLDENNDIIWSDDQLIDLNNHLNQRMMKFENHIKEFTFDDNSPIQNGTVAPEESSDSETEDDDVDEDRSDNDYADKDLENENHEDDDLADDDHENVDEDHADVDKMDVDEVDEIKMNGYGGGSQEY